MRSRCASDLLTVAGVRRVALTSAAEVAMTEWDAYIRELLAKRRAQPAGALLDDLLAVEEDGARLTEDEVLAAMRAAGHGSTQHLEAVVLEPNGTISVIAEVAEGSHSTLHQLANSATPPGVQD